MFTKTLIAVSLAAPLFAAPLAALAKDVVMLDETPSVEALKDYLAPEPTRRTRSIELVAKAPAQASAAPTQKAALSTTDAAPQPEAQPEAQPQPQGRGPVTIGTHIQFAYNSSKLSGSQPFLDQLGRVMSSRADLRLVVEGHTDASGSDAYNQVLSERRAGSVKAYLVKTWHVEPQRLEVEGKGKSEPLVADPYAPENRRVQFRPVG
jgi:outer membrane protein OmpA-like peptidoglycan-associated protein